MADNRNLQYLQRVFLLAMVYKFGVTFMMLAACVKDLYYNFNKVHLLNFFIFCNIYMNGFVNTFYIMMTYLFINCVVYFETTTYYFQKAVGLWKNMDLSNNALFNKVTTEYEKCCTTINTQTTKHSNLVNQANTMVKMATNLVFMVDDLLVKLMQLLKSSLTPVLKIGPVGRMVDKLNAHYEKYSKVINEINKNLLTETETFTPTTTAVQPQDATNAITSFGDMTKMMADLEKMAATLSSPEEMQKAFAEFKAAEDAKKQE